MELDSFIELSNQMCEPLESIITNFKEFVVNDIKNNCNYVNNGNLYYVEYKIPTGYISKYGKVVCFNVLENYLTGKEINRVLYTIINNKELYDLDIKKIKNNYEIKENMFAKFIYLHPDEDGNIDEDKKYLTKYNNADGIIYPIVIQKNSKK